VFASLSELSRSVQPEIKIRKQKIAKIESDFIKVGSEKRVRSLPCILFSRFIIFLQKFYTIFLAKKQGIIMGYQDMLIYSSIANIISILLKLSVICKRYGKDNGGMRSINKRKYSLIDQSSEKSMYLSSPLQLQS
jgi:hypothetical protein